MLVAFSLGMLNVERKPSQDHTTEIALKLVPLQALAIVLSVQIGRQGFCEIVVDAIISDMFADFFT